MPQRVLPPRQPSLRRHKTEHQPRQVRKRPPRAEGLPRDIKAATVIGLGGTGRCVAVQLAALGIPRLRLVDPRDVPRTKHEADGYRADDAGRAHRAADTNPLAIGQHDLDLLIASQVIVR